MRRALLKTIVPCLLVVSVLTATNADEPEPGPAAGIVASYVAGRLTLSAPEAKLSDVLLAIGEQAGIEVRVAAEADRLVRVDIVGVSLMEAIRRLLEDSVWVMLHGPSQGDGSGDGDARPGRVREIWVYGSVGDRPPRVLAMTRASPARESKSASAEADERAAAAELAALVELEGAAPSERLFIVDRLAQQPGEVATAVLGRILEEDDHPDVRARALRALARRNDAGVARAIERGLGDDEPALRLAVVNALVAAAGEAAVPSLGQVLFGDPDEELRLAAVQHLADSPGEASRALLEAAADDPDPSVREAASMALGTM